MECDLNVFDPFSPSSTSTKTPTENLSAERRKSSRQAILREKNGVYFLENFDPGQPASVNGKKVVPGLAVALKEGDSVQLGAATPIKFCYASMGESSTKSAIASIQKSVHFNDRSPRVHELTPDQRGSEHKSLKGRKQTPISGFLNHVKGDQSPGKFMTSSARRHERPMNIQTSSVERPTQRPVIAKVVTPLKGSNSIEQLKHPMSANPVKRWNTVDNITRIPTSEPRKALPRKSVSLTRQTPRAPPSSLNRNKTPVRAVSQTRTLPGVTPVQSNKKSGFPQFNANPVTSASRSESRVQFQLNNRRQILYSAQPGSRSAARPSQSSSLDKFMPQSPEDMSLANISEWQSRITDDSLTDESSANELEAEKAGTGELLALEDSNPAEVMNKRLSTQEEVLTDEEISAKKPDSGRKSRRDSIKRRSLIKTDKANVSPVVFTSPPPKSADRSKRVSVAPKTPIVVEEPEHCAEDSSIPSALLEVPKSATRSRKSRVSSVPRTPVVIEEPEPTEEQPVPPKSTTRGRKSVAKTPHTPIQEVLSDEERNATQKSSSKSAKKNRPSSVSKTPASEPIEAETTTKSTGRARKSIKRASVKPNEADVPPALNETYEFVEDPNEEAPNKTPAKRPNDQSYEASPVVLPSPAIFSPVQKSARKSARKPLNVESGFKSPLAKTPLKSPNLTASITATPRPLSEDQQVFSPAAEVGNKSLKKTPSNAATKSGIALTPGIELTSPVRSTQKDTKSHHETVTPAPFAFFPEVFSPPGLKSVKKSSSTSKTPVKAADEPTKPCILSPTAYVASVKNSAKKTPRIVDSLVEKSDVVEPMLSPIFNKNSTTFADVTTPNPFAEHPIMSPKPKSAKKKSTEPATPGPFAEHPEVFSPAKKSAKKTPQKTATPKSPEKTPLLALEPDEEEVTVKEVIEVPNSSAKKRKSAKRSMGVTFAKNEQGDDISPPKRPNAIPHRMHPTPANLAHKFRPSVGASPGQRGSLRKAMFKRFLDSKNKPEDSVSPVLAKDQRSSSKTISPPKKATKRPSMLTPDLRGIKRVFGKVKPGLTPKVGDMKKLFPEPKMPRKSVSSVLQPGVMQQIFSTKNKNNKELDEPIAKTMNSLFHDTISSRAKRIKPTEPILSPEPMRKLFATKEELKKNKVKLPQPEFASPNALKRLFTEKKAKPSQLVELDDEIAPLFERQDSLESKTPVTKKNARFAEPIEQPTPEHIITARVETMPNTPLIEGPVVEAPKSTSRGRGRKPKVEEHVEDVQQLEVLEEIASASKSRRGGRKAATVEKIVEESVVEPEPEPTKRGRRGAKKELEVPAIEPSEEPVEPAKPARGGRKKKSEPEPDEAVVEEVKENSPPPPKASRRGPRSTKKEVEFVVDSTEAEVIPEKPKRGGRTKKDTAEEIVVEEVVKPAKRSGKAAKKEPEPEPEVEEEKPVEVEPAKAKRGRGKKDDEQAVEKPVVVEPETTKRGRRGAKTEAQTDETVVDAPTKLPRKSTIRVTRAMERKTAPEPAIAEEPAPSKRSRAGRK